METLVLIVAFWLILVGAYGAITLRQRPQEKAVAPLPRARARPADLPAAPARRDWQRGRTAVPSEVDLLRAQVEHLRTEVLALAGSPPPRHRVRRQRPSPEAELPRPLRRQVREARSRRPLHA